MRTINEKVLQRGIAFVDALKKAIEEGDKTPLQAMCRRYKVNGNYGHMLNKIGAVITTNGKHSWLSDEPVATVTRKMILKARKYQKRLSHKPAAKRKYKARAVKTVATSTGRKLTSVDSVIRYVDIAHRYGVKQVNDFVKEMMNGSAKEVVHG